MISVYAKLIRLGLVLLGLVLITISAAVLFAGFSLESIPLIDLVLGGGGML